MRLGEDVADRVRRWAVRRRWWVGGAGAVVLVGVLVWILWPAGPAASPQPRQREYLEFTACLLTDSRGLSSPVAAPVWAGMQDSSLATRAKVQYLAVTGAQTPHNASLFATSMAQGGCRLVFAAGELAVSGVEEAAPAFPFVRFYLVGGQVSQPNVVSVDAVGDAAVRARVSQIIRDAVSSTP